MLQCRRNEKDFLLRKNLKYLGKHTKNIEKLNSNASNIILVAQSSNDAEFKDKGTEILKLSKSYQDSFKSLVIKYEEMGLDEKSGHQGQFRAAVHELSSIAHQYESFDLFEQYLLLRRWEKRLRQNKKRKIQNKTL